MDEEAADGYFEDQKRKIMENDKLQTRVRNRAMSAYQKNQDGSEPFRQIVEDQKREEGDGPGQGEEHPRSQQARLEQHEQMGTLEEEKEKESERLEEKDELYKEIEGQLGARLVTDQKKQLTRARRILHYKQVFLKLEGLLGRVQQEQGPGSGPGTGAVLREEEFPLRELLSCADPRGLLAREKGEREMELGALEVYRYFRPLLQQTQRRFFEEERRVHNSALLDKLEVIEAKLLKDPALRPRKAAGDSLLEGGPQGRSPSPAVKRRKK